MFLVNDCRSDVSPVTILILIQTVSKIDCGDIQVENDINYINVGTPADNYDCLWRIEKSQGVFRYEVQFVDMGNQTVCEEYQLLVSNSNNNQMPKRLRELAMKALFIQSALKSC